jgi:hypothetical protein
VSIQEAHGGVTAKNLSGSLAAGQIHGDIQLVNVAGAKLDQVHGNLHARSLANDLQVGEIGGDAGVRGIWGALEIENAQGVLQAYDLHGGLEAGHISGDLSLKAVPSPGQIYRANTDGEIRARFPTEVSARFDLQASGKISASLPTLELQEPAHVVGQAGAGETQVILQAGGDIWVHLQDPEAGELDAWKTLDSVSARIEAEISQHLGRMSVDARTQREIDNALRKAEQELAQAQRHLEQETQRAQQRAKRAQAKAAKAAKRAQQRIARQSRSWGVSVDMGPGLFGPPHPHRHPSRPERPRASAEEQLAILRMLQENKITVEEAEELLKALES